MHRLETILIQEIVMKLKLRHVFKLRQDDKQQCSEWLLFEIKAVVKLKAKDKVKEKS